MAFNKSKPPERKRDKATIEMLRKFRDLLLTDDISIARQAAFNLSWKQEDGLAILKEVLFGNYARTAKKAAAYGLRSMKGRMQKLAMEVHEQGLNHRDRTTKAVFLKSLSIMKGEVSAVKVEVPAKTDAEVKPVPAKQNIPILEIPPKKKRTKATAGKKKEVESL